MLILNEQKYAEDLYLGKNNDVKSIASKIGYVTRYLLHAKGYGDNDIYNYTVQWLIEHHNTFDESCYSNLIADAIKRAHKHPFYNINRINITQSELDIISSLNNLRAEKVLFVLLCMAKQQSVAFNFTNGLVRYSLPDLCKAARISVPSDEREYILYEIVQHGFLGYPKKGDTKCLIVNFIDNDGDAVLSLDEMDCMELAYIYLRWKNNGEGYANCEFCNRLMKKSKKSKNRYCKECIPLVGDVPDGMKALMCTSDDCSNIFYVDVRNMTKCRCDNCQSKKNAENTRLRVQKFRNKCDVTLCSETGTIQN